VLTEEDTVTKGRKALLAWLDLTGMPGAEAARRAHVSLDAWYAWTSGRSTPDLRSAAAVRTLTGIPAEDWLVDADPEA